VAGASCKLQVVSSEIFKLSQMYNLRRLAFKIARGVQLPLATCNLQPATCHLQPATCSALATCNLIRTRRIGQSPKLPLPPLLAVNPGDPLDNRQIIDYSFVVE